MQKAITKRVKRLTYRYPFLIGVRKCVNQVQKLEEHKDAEIEVMEQALLQVKLGRESAKECYSIANEALTEIKERRGKLKCQRK